jgi:ActR/RegA family two-component response regulator
MITGYGDVPTAVSAMKAGAFHFVENPFDAEALLTTVEEALSRPSVTRGDPDEIRRFNARQARLTQREREVLALLLEGFDQMHRPTVADQPEDRRTSQGRRDSKDGGAQHFPPHANGVHCQKSQRRRANRRILS